MNLIWTKKLDCSGNTSAQRTKNAASVASLSGGSMNASDGVSTGSMGQNGRTIM